MPARPESRVVLRPLSPSHQDEFTAAMRASRRLHGRWLSPPKTPEAFGQWLLRTRDETFESMLACRREDGAIIGYFKALQYSQLPGLRKTMKLAPEKGGKK